MPFCADLDKMLEKFAYLKACVFLSSYFRISLLIVILMDYNFAEAIYGKKKHFFALECETYQIPSRQRPMKIAFQSETKQTNKQTKKRDD